MATQSKGNSATLAGAMPDGAHIVSRLGSRGAPRKRISRVLSSGLRRSDIRRHAARLAGALPAVVKAQPGTRLWTSALIGPATYPKGYRDAVALSKGRLIGLKVRQTGSGGHLHADPAREIGRALAAYRARRRSHRDRQLRPLIPSVQVNFAWLRTAARRHDIPLNASLVAALLETVNASGKTAKAKFRATLDPDVAALLTDDLTLERFYTWIADEALPRKIRAHRREAFRAAGTGCEHIRSRRKFASRLDKGTDALRLLGQILEADPAALAKLAAFQPEALGSLEEAQRKAWALELMPDEVRAELPSDLERAGGWAGRAMSFAAAATDDPALRREIARRLLSRPGLRRFIDYPATFGEWSYEDGRKEFAELLSAVVRFGLLPGVMVQADAGLRRGPTASMIADAPGELGRVISGTSGVMTVELARLLWRKVQILPQVLVAACLPSRDSWPQLFRRSRRSPRAVVECIATKEELEKEDLALAEFPALLHEVLVLGHHVLRLRDPGGATVALTVVRHDELEAASDAGGVVPRQIERHAWSATPQWKRGMRVEIGRVIHALARRSRHLQGLRERIEKRRIVAEALREMPCGFDHANAEARDIAAGAMARILKLLLPDREAMLVRLFGPARDPSLEADSAFLSGDPPPAPAPDPVSPGPAKIKAVSPAFRILPEDVLGIPVDYEPGAALGKIRRHVVGKNAITPLDPLTARYVVVDFETTGLEKPDRIVEIAAIEMKGPKPTGRTFHKLVDPGRAISDGAYEKHGIDQAALRGMPKFADVCEDLIAFLRGGRWWLVAHNAGFDLGFLNRELKRAGARYSVSPNRTICTMRLAAACVDAKGLDEVCDKLDIEHSGRDKHRAMMDAELCAAVFTMLIFGREAIPVPSAEASPGISSDGIAEAATPAGLEDAATGGGSRGTGDPATIAPDADL